MVAEKVQLWSFPLFSVRLDYFQAFDCCRGSNAICLKRNLVTIDSAFPRANTLIARSLSCSVFLKFWKCFLGNLLSLAWQFQEQIHLASLQSNFLSSLLAISWIANFVASSSVFFSTVFCYQLHFFVFSNESPTSDWSKFHFHLFRKRCND